MSADRGKPGPDDFIEEAPFVGPERVEHPDGVYFGMPESEYFADTALGSTDMRVLSYSAPDYWFSSRFNPLREEKETTPAQLYGRAVHTLILEGREKFERLYAPKMHSWSTKEGKAEKERFAERGLLPLPWDDWRRAQQTGAVLRGNKFLAGAFEGSVGHEVSVFWTMANGMRKRARFDALKERAIVDLKNVSNERAIAFPKACVRKIGDYSYHLQAAHYIDGWLRGEALLRAGKVFGEHDPDMLKKALGASELAFVFIFLQSAGAPVVWSTQMSFITGPRGERAMNPALELGFAKIARADENWRRFVSKFGLDTPWVEEHPIEEFDIETLPPWILRGDDDAAT